MTYIYTEKMHPNANNKPLKVGDVIVDDDSELFVIDSFDGLKVSGHLEGKVSKIVKTCDQLCIAATSYTVVDDATGLVITDKVKAEAAILGAMLLGDFVKGVTVLKNHRTEKDIKDDVPAHIPLREVKSGEYFRVSRFDKGAVYRRGHFCNGMYHGKRDNRYSCENQGNGNEVMMSGDKMVFVGFEY